MPGGRSPVRPRGRSLSEPFPHDEVHLWLAAQDAIREPALLEKYTSWLTPEERTRQQRFVFDRHRHEFLVTRALVRWTLSRYAEVDPAAWRFELTEYGRPFVVAPDVSVPCFNLSNTDGLIVCGVSAHPLGVDTERFTRASSILEMADTVFSSRELTDLRALPHAERARRVVELWTLKEAYLKAIGTGLSAPLRRFSILFDGARRSVAFELDDDPARWQVSVHTVGAHCVGVFAARGAKRDLAVRLRPITPGVH